MRSDVERAPQPTVDREVDDFSDTVVAAPVVQSTSAVQAAAGKADTDAAGTPTLSLAFTPTDSLFGNLWHLLNTGQGGGVAGLDIDVTDVWDD